MTKLLPPIVFSRALASLLALAMMTSCDKTQDDGSAPAGSSIKKAPEESATRVEVAILAGGNVATRLVRPGEVEGAREAKLGAALGGYVERVMVNSGDTLTKGQLIARIDSSTHGAQLSLSKVELGDAEQELARVKKLGKAIASARVDAAETRVARAKAQQRVVANQMSRSIIKAPFAGVLVNLQIEQGEVASPGQPIGRLLVLDPIAISVSVTDQDVGSLKTGSRVMITTAGSSAAIEGKVTRIESAADLLTRTFLVQVQAPNPDHKLLPGMIASVAFEPTDRGEALLLPQDLLVTKLQSNGVFVVGKDSVAHWRPLQLGGIVGEQVEVLSGIARGERIVTVGMRLLSDGDKVIAARHGVCCTDGRVVFDVNPTAKPAEPVDEPATIPSAPSKEASSK